MTPYEAGFAAGERESFYDRQHGGMPKLRPPSEAIRGMYGLGYWEGYTPRSPAWRLTKAPVNWLEDSEAA